MIKRSLLTCLLLFARILANAQSGCTDPAASNYDPSATITDSSCIYPVTHKAPVLKGALNHIITESSGLVWTDGKLWTHNDSGDPPNIFSIDTTDGHTLQTVIIDNYPNVDWEDITADSNYIYVGDHGNNKGDRTNLKVLKIAKSDIGSDSVVHVNAQAIAFSYTDQISYVASSTNNFDCEALMSIKDSLYIFTKDRGDMSSRVYKMPKMPGTYELTPYTSFHVDGLITGADYNPDTHEVVLIGYMSSHANSFLWFLNDFPGDRFFSGNKRRIEIGNGKEWQTEGVAWLSDNRYFISCESTDPIPASLYTCDMNFIAAAGIKNISKATYSVYPNPASDILYINNAAAGDSYRIINAAGQAVLTGAIQASNDTVNIKGIVPGLYTITLKAVNGKNAVVKFEKK